MSNLVSISSSGLLDSFIAFISRLFRHLPATCKTHPSIFSPKLVSAKIVGPKMERGLSDYLLSPFRLSTSEADEGSVSSFLENYEKHSSKHKSQKLLSRIFSLWPLLVASLLFFTSLGLFAGAMWRTPNDMECTTQLSPYCKEPLHHPNPHAS